MKKWKLIWIVSSMLILLPMLFYSATELHAFSSPTFSLYEKVHIANNTYTVISNDGTNVKLLMDTTTGSAQTWTNANTAAKNFPSNTNVGVLGSEVLKNTYSLPLSTELTTLAVANTLNANIPKATGDWWLGDATVNNRNKFLTQTNSFNGKTTINSITASVDPNTYLLKCTPTTKQETGVKLTKNQTETPSSASILKEKQIAIETTKTPNTSVGGTLYTDSTCKTVKTTNSPIESTALNQTKGSMGISWNKGELAFERFISTAVAGGGPFRIFIRENQAAKYVNQWKKGDKYSMTLSSSQCYKQAVGVGASDPSTDLYYKPSVDMTFDFTIYAINKEVYETQYCKAATNNAGTALTRPMTTVPITDIVSANTTQRTYTPDITLSGSFPSSDSGNNKPFVTLLNSNLKVNLTNGATGVNGNTYNTINPSDGILNLPVTVTGNTEGARYISASANIGGVQKYGVLKQATSNIETVSIDLHQFASDPTSLSQITLTLYQENAGSYMTSYMGNGTDITVNLQSQQNIAFDDGQSNTGTYGDIITLNAHLVSSLDKQSSQPISFSIVSGDATIDFQNYVAATGLASVNILPASGTGSVVIAIDKAGDANAAAASQQTFTLNLTKKQISVAPNHTSGTIYGVGDSMPVISSTTNGLVNGDTLPNNLKPNLEPLNGAATSPFTNGKVTEVGTWKLVYPLNILNNFSDLTKKYDITLEDYNTNTDYVFETAMSDIPEGWVIIAPDANAAGWNAGSVTVAPSQDAKSNGFTVIELVNDAGTVLQSGASIVYANETTISGMKPKVQLKKGSYTSNTIDTRTIYIDKTKPSASLVVDKEYDWAGSKKVEITATDALSGIQSVIVDRDGIAYTPTLSGNVYTFHADENGTYLFTVTDKAGNVTTITKDISKIAQSAISIQAVPETVSKDVPKQKITITYQAGASGVYSLGVYYKANVTDPYTLLDSNLNQGMNPLDWDAEMNGYFKFELVNNALEKAEAEVQITQVNPPVPVTQIIAYEKGNRANAYAGNTWVNYDVTIEVTNANTDVSDPVTWEVSENDGASWTPLVSTIFDVTTSTFLEKTYLLRGKTDTTKEQSPKAFSVKLDQSEPPVPNVQDANQYTQNDWYADDVTLSIHTVPKASGIAQTLYVCENTQSICENDQTKWTTNHGTLAFSGNGVHELYFKSIDVAGNESAISDAVYVNINSSQPLINIKLQNDPVKQLLNHATLGFFFKDTVSIDIEVTYDPTGIQRGVVYYIIENEDAKPAPDENDPRWTLGNHTTITPDAKGKVYVKAVSDAGVIAYENSVLSVYADQSAPNITLPPDMTSWINDLDITVEITDELSGVDPISVVMKEDSDPVKAFSLQNSQATITMSKDGRYPLVIAANDYSGNSASATMQVMIDTQKPNIQTVQADTSGYAKQKTITVAANDVLSGMDEVSVSTQNGSGVSVIEHGDGTYSFTIHANDMYTIKASDCAGNETTSIYTETMIDVDGPVIDNISITDEAVVRPSKPVSFTVSDAGSGVDTVIVTIEMNGMNQTVPVKLPETGNGYSFTATENGTYTITATDQVSNVSTQQVTLNGIDTAGIHITNISDIGSWVKDQMSVSFEVQSAIPLASGYPLVTYQGNPVSLSESNGIYTFTATENGDYAIKAMDESGQLAQELLTIQRIDAYAPRMEQLSSNITDTEYREPQKITFHVHDYNDTASTKEGSGMKYGYPKLFILLNGVKTDIPLTQDSEDTSKYQFLAEYNGEYVLELQDAVEHPLVSETIPVDHILNQGQVTPIVVEAYNDTRLITSGTWVKGSIRFEISGGLDASTLVKYQVAVTKGAEPDKSDWMDCNKGNNAHELTEDINGDAYWFRAVPLLDQKLISKPFIVCLDNTPPDTLTIQKQVIQPGLAARLINLFSFGGWMNETQKVTFDAEDNFTAKENITYMYREINPNDLNAPVIWKRYNEALTYRDSNVKLLVKAIDQAGNESAIATDEIKIDSVPPNIAGVKDESEYKYYYLPRYVSVSDQGSGLSQTSYRKDGGTSVEFNHEVSLKDVGTYDIYASDQAGNEATLNFKIVPLPNLEDIDGSDEAKEIIDQIREELAEIIDQIDANESANYVKWIDDATDQWSVLRKQVLIHEGTTIKVEGIQDTSFDPCTELVVEEMKQNELPPLPNELYQAFDVYLRKNGNKLNVNGHIKVFLPYEGTENITLYEVHKDATVTEITFQKEKGYLVFETDKLGAYAITQKAESTKPDPEQPNIKPEEPKKCSADINYDSDKDGKPDVNIDLDHDCVADINIDTDGDHIPDINIDIKGDGNPHYNIDIDADQIADMNIGAVVWKPKLCVTINKVAYCTSNYYRPVLNIDTDEDGKPDINIDLDKDEVPDLNIDIDGNEGEKTADFIPDINIDSDGDQIADINIDINEDGWPDKKLLLLTEWKPDFDVYGPFLYDTMKGLKADETLSPDEWYPSNQTENKIDSDKSVQGVYHENLDHVGGTQTSDATKLMSMWLLVIVSGSIAWILRYVQKIKHFS